MNSDDSENVKNRKFRRISDVPYHFLKLIVMTMIIEDSNDGIVAVYHDQYVTFSVKGKKKYLSKIFAEVNLHG